MGNPGPAIRTLLPEDTLLRLLRSARMAKELPEAFMLRTDEKASGLSVNFDWTPQECQEKTTLNKTHGVASLRVASVTELNLGVVPDEPNHANITGVPHKEDDPKLAEYLANELAKRSALVSTTVVKRV
jgi:hypothetical protein